MVEKYPRSFDLKQPLPPEPANGPANPKVSILVTTYNQENLITHAINSILAQEVNFAYEIVIGEDASQDRTREIVVELGKQYPDKIRVMLRNPEEADRDRRIRLAGKINYLNALRACRGQYIAILDGDDYFTSTHKLQRQVDFLDIHPECAICFHNVLAIYEDGSREPEKLCPADQKPISDIKQLLWGNFIPACSIMYRREPLIKIPDWFLTARMGDWPLNIFKAQQGKIGYIDEVMAAYRVHVAGVWSLRRRSHQLLTSIKVLDNIDRDLGFKYSDSIRGSKTRFFFELAELYVERGHSRFALIPLKLGLWASRGRHKGLLSLWLRLRTPGLYRGYTNLKKAARTFAQRRKALPRF
ncbi:MAG TPA: glycosyltransferase [Pyrinomonadaceae bacterium]|nr:glycosyltransferase [Pyrinomonadaceae bacterium]